MRKVISLLVMAGLLSWQVPGIAGYHMSPRQAFYYHAHKGNLSALQKLKSMGHSVNMSDEYGNSALCESVYRQDYSAFAMLKQVGATTAHPCVSKIPQQTVQQFNQGYANWAQAVNSGKIAYAGATTQTATTTTATAGTMGTATVATTTGLSTAAMVGIGVGAAALVGGGIALAAGGGGGGGSSSSAPAECSSHGSKDTEGKCQCHTGYAGENCSDCAENYGKYGTNSCHLTKGCNTSHGSQKGDSCVCNAGWTGDELCNTATTCGTNYVASCPTGYTHSQTCKSGNTTLYLCDTCATDYTKIGGECVVKMTCNNHGQQIGDGVCDCDTGYAGNQCDTCDTGNGYVQSGSICVIPGTCSEDYNLTTPPDSNKANYEICTEEIPNKYKITSCKGNWTNTANGCETCSLTPGATVNSNTCGCIAGYEKSGSTCVSSTISNVSGTGYIFRNGVDTGYRTYTNNENVSLYTSDFPTQEQELNYLINFIINSQSPERFLLYTTMFRGRAAFSLMSRETDTYEPLFVNSKNISISSSENDELQNQMIGISVLNGNSINHGEITLINPGILVSSFTEASTGYGIAFVNMHEDVGQTIGDGISLWPEDEREFYAINNGKIKINTNEDFSKVDNVIVGLGPTINLAQDILAQDIIIGRNEEGYLTGFNIENEYAANLFVDGSYTANNLKVLQNRLISKNNVTAEIEINKGTGVHVIGAKFSNEGEITVDEGIGVQSALSTVVNSGTITVNGKLGTSTKEYSGSGIVAGSSDIINTSSGTINVTNGYGIYAEDSLVENYGTINVANGVGIKAIGNSTVYNAGTINAPTQIEGSTVNAGQYNSDTGMKLSANSYTVMPASTTSSKEFISGSAMVSIDTVMGGNKNTYIEKDMFVAPDTTKLKLKSESVLFDAKLADNGKDVVMTMKGFDTTTSNKSLANFLSKNYALGNNEAFFNKLKSFGNMSALTDSLNKLTGKDMLSRFTFEDMTMMRELNFDMNDKLFHNKEQHFALAGSVSPMAFKGDAGSNARYSLFNKRDGNKSIGLGIAFTDVRSDDTHEDNDRHETSYQLILPMGYKAGGFNLVTSPRIGYARGTYDRTGFDNTSYDGTIEKRVFGLMNEARYPITVGKWKLEPSAEFNILGYQQKGHEEDKDYALNIQSQNTLSVEGGIGLYATREEELDKDTTLKLTAGMAAYHEFADPYRVKVGMNGMDGAFTLRDEKRSDNRGVIRIGFDYAYRDLSLYGSLISYIDREARTSAKTGMKLKF